MLNRSDTECCFTGKDVSPGNRNVATEFVVNEHPRVLVWRFKVLLFLAIGYCFIAFHVARILVPHGSFGPLLAFPIALSSLTYRQLHIDINGVETITKRFGTRKRKRVEQFCSAEDIQSYKIGQKLLGTTIEIYSGDARHFEFHTWGSRARITAALTAPCPSKCHE